MASKVEIKKEQPSDQIELYTRRVRSWDAAQEELGHFDTRWMFRGQCNAEWGLQCLLDRGRATTADPIDAEAEVRRTFVQRAHLFLPSTREPETVLEWLALIQHHGGPTRLLDFTRSPLVAAFFALCDESGSDLSAVWAIDETACHRRAVKRLRVLDSEFHWLKEHHNIEGAVEARLGARPATRFVAPIQPSRLNARMAIQQGVFVCLGDPGRDLFGNLIDSVEEEEPLRVVKIEFPRAHRGDALWELRRLNISRDTLFPGLDGLAQSLLHNLIPRSVTREILFNELSKPSGWPGGE